MAPSSKSKEQWLPYGNVTGKKRVISQGDRLAPRLMWKILTSYGGYAYVGYKDGKRIQEGDYLRVAHESHVSKILKTRSNIIKALTGKPLPKETYLIENGTLQYYRHDKEFYPLRPNGVRIRASDTRLLGIKKLIDHEY